MQPAINTTNKKLNIALVGYGKMGKAIEAIAVQRGHTIGLKIDINTMDQFTKENLQGCDVAIEFTNPHSAVENIITCLRAGVPVISGSTGWLERWDEVKSVCDQQQGALLYASNYSVGVNIFFEVNKRLAQLMNPHTEYEVTMTEIHHTEKRMPPAEQPLHLLNKLWKISAVKKNG
jgi:4-hydroxy-tetrahydrodipicolinate reductase